MKIIIIQLLKYVCKVSPVNGLSLTSKKHDDNSLKCCILSYSKQNMMNKL